MQLHSLPDITLTSSAATPLTAALAAANWIQITLISSTSGIRIGDSLVSASRGIPVVDGGGQFLPQNEADVASRYDMSQVFVAGTSGDVLAVNYGL